ncbi:MAG: Tyrosine-protein kinase YwqD [Chloroflexi bacterium]|nr:Tyrosine-protein kinase YwqD [Chloroflexota bacterium]
MTQQSLSMEPQPLSEDLRHYFILLWHWAWLIALATVLAALASYLVSDRKIPIYQASSTLMINEAPGTRSTDYTAVLTSQRLTQTYAEMLTKKPVLDEVITRLELPMDAVELESMVTVQPVRDTQLIDIQVEDTDPNRAAAIANEVGKTFSEQNEDMQASRYASTKQSLKNQLDDIQLQIDEVNTSLAALPESEDNQVERDRLENILTQYRQTYASTLQSYEQVRLAEAETLSNVLQVELATPPENPVRPRVLMNTALAGVVGAMLAVGAIFLMEALDDTIRGPEDIKRYLQLPVLSVIHQFDEEEETITISQPRSPISESFRSLRTNIQYSSVDFPLRKILVTSPMQGEGKTTVAANLGVVMAQGGKKVSLVDADLRRPRLHHQMQVSNRGGLSSLFVGEDIRLDGAFKESEVSGLHLLTSGNLPPNPAELMASERMYRILSTIEEQSDVIVVDSPPVTAVTDSVVLSKHVDGVLLVMEPGKTKVAAAQKIVEELRRVGANIIGVVLNNVGANGSRYSYYYTYYYTDEYYGGHKAPKKRKKKK